MVMRKEKISQGERIARIIHLLITDGSKSYPEIEEKFPMVSTSTIKRDIKLLKRLGLIVEKRVAKTTGEKNSRKVFIFFKDNKDVVGKTENAMEALKREFIQVTLDQIASRAGFPPSIVEEHAFALAPKLKLIIGKKEISVQPTPLVVGKT